MRCSKSPTGSRHVLCTRILVHSSVEGRPDRRTLQRTDVRPGDYQVREVVPAGFIQTAPSPAAPRLFALNTSAAPDLIVELDPQTGQQLNSFDQPGFDTPAAGIGFDGDTLYVVDAAQDQIFALDPDTGTTVGTMQLPSASYDGIAAVDDLLYVVNLGLDDILVIDFDHFKFNAMEFCQSSFNPFHFRPFNFERDV